MKEDHTINDADGVHHREKDLTSSEKKGNPLEPEFIPAKDESKDETPVAEAGPPPVAFFKLFRYSTGTERLLMLLGVLGAFVTGLCSPANILMFGDLSRSMVDEAKAGSAADFMADIVFFAIGNSVVGILMLVFSYLSIACFNYAGQKQIFRIRNLFFQSALHQDIGWYDLQQTGDFASRMSEDLAKLEEGIGEKVVMFIHYLVTFLGCLILAFTQGWELALICLTSMPVTMISLGIVGKCTSNLAKKEMDAYGKAGSIAEEVLGSMRTVMAFSGQEKEIARYGSNLVYAKDINVKKGFFSGLGFGLLWFFIYSSYALAFWYGVGLVLDDKQPDYDAGTMVTVFFGVMMGSMNLGMGSPYIEAFSVAKGAGAKVFSVIYRISPINSRSEEGLKPSSIEGSITFQDTHFEYPSRTGVKVLVGLNLNITRGETVALVGSSGCGKSTCIQLIQRFYDPLQGKVLLDNVDVKELNVAWLRKHIGVVGQEPVLFGTTILENIRYGNMEATKKDIERAAREANAHDFISKLPQGYETLVGERGAQLSGGQKQRIAIARALVRNPSILLLDEATSALDTGSEAKVQSALDKASRGRTTVIVAHRLSTIRHADKIVVLSGGAVVEEGTHMELMERKGHYYALVTAQVKSLLQDDSELTSSTDDAKAYNRKISRMLSVESNTSSIEDAAHDHSYEDEPVPALAVDDDELPPIPMGRILAKNREEWPYILTGSLSSIVMGGAMPVFAVLFGEILGVFVLKTPEEVRSETNIYCIYFVAAGLVVGFATFLQIYTYGIAGEKLTERLRGQLFASMVRQEIAWFDDKSNNTGSLCARLSGDASSVQGATGQRVGTILQSLTTLILGVGLAMYFEWRLGLVSLSFTPIILVANYFHMNILVGEALGNRTALEKSTKLAVESIGNIRTVAGLGRELTFHEQYVAELLPAHKLGLRNTHWRGVVFGMARSIMFFAYSATMYYGGILITSEDDDVKYPEVFKVSQALIMGTVSIANAMAFAPNFQKGLIAAIKIFHLIDRQPKIYDPKLPNSDMPTAVGYVDYTQVEFFYPTRLATKVLQGLTLEVKQGQTVALVGQSGCGKSTCIQLLERFYDATSGKVSLDGRDVTSVTLRSLRANLGIVSQEPVLFDRTIADNIAYGDNTREVAMDEIIAVARQANIHTFIASQPLGYNTRMGEKGTQLSGGQKQRVAIARALVRNPRVLLLDEATSALDTESEKVVQEALDKAKEGRTCITIAHRLSTIQDADVICVINHGKVAEIGTHAELLASKGLYYKLHKLQGGQR